MITGLACSLSVSVSLYSERARAPLLSLLPRCSLVSPLSAGIRLSSLHPLFSPFHFLPRFTIRLTRDTRIEDKTVASVSLFSSAADWDDVAVSDTVVFTFYRVACLVFSILAHRILRADGAKGEGAAAPVRYDGDGGRAFHLPDLSPAPSPEVPLNNNFDRQIGVVHISGFDRYLAKLSALPAVPLCDGRATRRLKPGNQPAGSPRTKQRFAFSSRLLRPRSFLFSTSNRASSFFLSSRRFSIASLHSRFSQDTLRCRSEIS